MPLPQIGCHFETQITDVATAGTAVQLSAAEEHISRITFRGAGGNTGNVAIGKSDVTMTSAGWVLQPGESVTLNFGEKSVLLSDFYADAATNGDDLEWIVGAELITGAGTQGAIAHSATTGRTADDHHTESHAFNAAAHTGAIDIADVDLDGGTDIGAVIVDADLFLIDDGAGGTNRKTQASRLKTYIGDDKSARVFHSANQSLTDATVTVLAFDSERFDTDTIHDTATNNSRLTATTAGKYWIHGQVNYADNATGRRDLTIRLNGTTTIADVRVNPISGADTTVEVSTFYDLSATDYVELLAFQNSGGALNVQAVAQQSPEFMMFRTVG